MFSMYLYFFFFFDFFHTILESLNPRIPAKIFERHYTLKRTDSYDGLGIYISTDAKTRLNHRIRDIEPNSPGSRVGLRVNDRITHVNGINVENTQFGDVLVLIKQGLINNNLQFSVINE
jgi:C-terminal processing protease CtpA/Prc